MTLILLPELLSWQTDSRDALDLLLQARYTCFGRLLSLELQGTASVEAKAAIAKQWTDLSLSGVERLLRSPSVCQALRTSAGVATLRRAVEAEALFGKHPREYLNSWTALGDIWLGSEPPGMCDASLLKECNGYFIGPALECGIPVDLSLPARLQFPNAGPQSPPASAMGEIVRLLNRAMILTSVVSASAYRMVRQMTSNIVLRTDLDQPKKVRSASSAAAIGRTVIVNADCADASVADLAEALVHEATHATLSSIELEVPMLTNLDPADQPTERSPWSGDSLRLHAFLHACVVWYALLHFWEQARVGGILLEEAETRRRRILGGFASLHVDRRLKRYRGCLAPSSLAVLKRIEEGALEHATA